MQQTCSRCGGLLVPGASVCNYCGFPVSASSYPQPGSVLPGWQASSAPPPGTQYGGGYSQTTAATDPYSAQYGSVASPPQAPAGTGGYGPPPFGQPSQPSPFGPPSQPSPFGAPPYGMAPQPPQKRSSGLIIGVVVLIALVLVGAGIGGFIWLRSSSNTTANLTPTPNPADILYQASLTQDDSGNWKCGKSGTCTFSSDGYHIKATEQGFIEDSILTKQTFDNQIIQVTGVLLKGDAKNAGLVLEFHIPQDNSAEGYGFFVYIDGTYSVIKWDTQGEAHDIVADTPTGSIHKGLNQKNDLKIAVNGSHFTFYINNERVFETNDSSYASGYTGLAAATLGTEAVFTNLLITKP